MSLRLNLYSLALSFERAPSMLNHDDNDDEANSKNELLQTHETELLYAKPNTETNWRGDEHTFNLRKPVHSNETHDETTPETTC